MKRRAISPSSFSSSGVLEGGGLKMGRGKKSVEDRRRRHISLLLSSNEGKRPFSSGTGKEDSSTTRVCLLLQLAT